MPRHDMPTLIGGTLLLLTASAFGVFALRLPLGTAQHMGPGYFPLLAAIVLGLLAVGTIALAFRRSVPINRPTFWPVLWVLASTVLFALTVRTLGLVPAVFLSIVTASIADRSARLVHAVILGIGVSGLSWAIFVALLHLPLTAFRVPL